MSIHLEISGGRTRPVAVYGFQVIMLLLAGCISTGQSSLAPVHGQMEYQPKSQFVGKTSASSLRHESFRTLRPGCYSPIGRNALGVWYLGKGENLWEYVPNRKNGDKSLLISYMGGVVLSDVPGESTFVQIRSTAKSYWVSSAEEADRIILAAANVGMPKTFGNTAGTDQAAAFVNAGAHPVGAAVGGVVADALLAYDSEGMFPMPQWDSTKGLESWLKSDKGCLP